MQKIKTQKGITLIALIITIIVMLILVGVSVTVALNGGLFNSAQDATSQTKIEAEKEKLLSIALGALDNEGKVEPSELDAALEGTEFEGENGTYTSTKTGKTYVVSQRGSVTEKQTVAIMPKKETYTVGEPVTIGNEAFYVIADDAVTVTVLAKYNLNKSGKEQLNASNNETGCAFSSRSYWENETSFPVNLNEYPIPSDATSIITTAKEYGSKITGNVVEGRLMRKDEAEKLRGEYPGIIYGTSINDTDGYLYYWLGGAENNFSVYYVNGQALDINYMMSSLTAFGVRPVIEVPKSAI